ncbi:MAG: YggT family protein [Methylacidiphilales bacterium]|nr:YggT family protein [Candidatus Methylacidiphilales bacterium]NJR19072.1 YggT family protein [Calothrix sp. CSU_2_0]
MISPILLLTQALSVVSSIIDLLTGALSVIVFAYIGLLVIRILLTWFPTVNWYNQPFLALSQITDPYLNLFRSIVPPLGGMDFSPMLAIFALQFLFWSGILPPVNL